MVVLVKVARMQGVQLCLPESQTTNFLTFKPVLSPEVTESVNKAYAPMFGQKRCFLVPRANRKLRVGLPLKTRLPAHYICPEESGQYEIT